MPTDNKDAELTTKIDEVIKQMDLIQIATCNELIGNMFTWRARCLAATVHMEQGNTKEGYERLEKVLIEQTEYLGTAIHPTLDMTYNHLIQASQRARDYERTEEILGLVCQLRRTIYGDRYEGIVVPMLRLAAI